MNHDFEAVLEHYQMVVHHHAVAMEYLVAQVVLHAGGEHEARRQEAFEFALKQWQEQEPKELEALLERTTKALRQAVSAVNARQGDTL